MRNELPQRAIKLLVVCAELIQIQQPITTKLII